ncbi:uncharacterized protein BP5553_01434 [Venustampulla echinocandica]|uniref:Uncharacterized protein n=1 Tax=Venustampulla echinocandica TaxID=2656787 RepID=A0A370U114_9HELO|nr:uncharacterized protein BP5553_01434 [Venustampulla echinocandica]RDL41455.1 hypothetical protein BP5553_01434 [Venustampulla echinocandica]
MFGYTGRSSGSKRPAPYADEDDDDDDDDESDTISVAEAEWNGFKPFVTRKQLTSFLINVVHNGVDKEFAARGRRRTDGSPSSGPSSREPYGSSSNGRTQFSPDNEPNYRSSSRGPEAGNNTYGRDRNQGGRPRAASHRSYGPSSARDIPSYDRATPPPMFSQSYFSTHFPPPPPHSRHESYEEWRNRSCRPPRAGPPPPQRSQSYTEHRSREPSAPPRSRDSYEPSDDGGFGVRTIRIGGRVFEVRRTRC